MIQIFSVHFYSYWAQPNGSTNLEIIKAYFKDRKSNFKVRYLEEKKPLGTAGGLKKLYGKVKTSFFVTNCDVLVDTNLVDFLIFTKKKSQIQPTDTRSSWSNATDYIRYTPFTALAPDSFTDTTAYFQNASFELH